VAPHPGNGGEGATGGTPEAAGGATVGPVAGVWQPRPRPSSTRLWIVVHNRPQWVHRNLWISALTCGNTRGNRPLKSQGNLLLRSAVRPPSMVVGPGGRGPERMAAAARQIDQAGGACPDPEVFHSVWTWLWVRLDPESGGPGG
jgi:hypothetical protein